MTDIEMTGLCALAIGWRPLDKPARLIVSHSVSDSAIIAKNERGGEIVFDPLTKKAQAFTLMEKLKLSVWQMSTGCKVFVSWPVIDADDPDLSRAIVCCGAAIQAAKVKP